MIRCCSKFSIPLPSRSGSPVSLGRLYVAYNSRDTTQKRYTSGGNQPPRRFRTIFFTTVGLTLVGVGGAVVYAKNDPRFRKVLDSYVPGTDKFISVIYQEEGSLNVNFITEQLSTLQEKVLSLPTEVYKQISGEDATPAPSKAKETKPEVKVAPIKATPVPGHTSKKPVVVTVSSDVTADVKAAGKEALKLYEECESLIKDSGTEIIDLIDKSIEDADQTTWNEIKKKVDENKKTLDTVESKIKSAGEAGRKFSSLMRSGKLLPEEVESLKLLETNIQLAKARIEDLKNSKLAASNKYFGKIEEARKQFTDELTILFPNIRLNDKQLRLKEDEIDLFLYYAVQKLLYYQKELTKLETLTSQRLKKATQENKELAPIIQETVEHEVNMAKRKIKEDFDKKALELKAACDKEVHDQLKRQEQVHIDLLNEQLQLREKEVERKLIQRMDDRILEEQRKVQEDLADMTGRMQGLNDAISKRALQDHKAMMSQALWTAAEALYSSLKTSSSDKDWAKKLQPLDESVDVIKNAAAKGDDLVEVVLATIPSVALKRGVYPEDALRERFMKVEKMAWRVAGLPDGRTSLPKFLIAWLQSCLIMKSSEPIPSSELNNEPIDPSKLNNYDVIQRARYWVDRGDFEQALRYMNLLKGGAKSVSSDWMKEVTILLETEQAAVLLLAHAAASGMIYS